MASGLTYAVVTPARDEAANLSRLAGAIAAQRLLPRAWVIVDNGSTDATSEVAHEIADESAYAIVCSIPRRTDVVRGAPVVQAFHAGLDALDVDADIIVKLDADVSFGADHFQRLLAEFAANPKLGIAAGVCYEQDPDGVWRQRHGTGIGIRGACRAYRRACLDQILPLDERLGWDTLDLVKARTRGWTTDVVHDLAFLHHRPEGARERTSRERWSAQGEAAYYMGYRLSYLLLRVLYKAPRQPGAIALIEGYLRASALSLERCPDPRVIAFVREQQSLRRLPQRVGEALRRSEALTG